MSQTDNAAVAAHLSHVRIVMVNTTLPANIGSALRAMKTMGLCKLVLVDPKTYPHPDIDALAAGATDLIEQIEVVEHSKMPLPTAIWSLVPVHVVVLFLGHS